MILLTQFRMQAGPGYNPYALFTGRDRMSASISVGVTGLNTKDPEFFCFGNALSDSPPFPGCLRAVITLSRFVFPFIRRSIPVQVFAVTNAVYAIAYIEA